MKSEVIIVGGGQAGLSISYFLKEHGVDHVIFDRANDVADSWRRRWDSMKMITPNWVNNSLPGPDYPGEPNAFSTRVDTVKYFENYVREVKPPLRLGVAVKRVVPKGAGFEVHTGDGEVHEAGQVVIAVGPYQKPKVPGFASKLDDRVTQLHSGEYRNPEQFAEGSTVVVVGSGNSGTAIAIDLAKRHSVVLAQGSKGNIPRQLSGATFQMVYEKLTGGEKLELTDEQVEKVDDFMWWMKFSGLFEAPPGTAFYEGAVSEETESDPYIGPEHTEVAGEFKFELGGRVVGVEGDDLILEENQRVKPDVVIWATGWRRDLSSWIECSIFDKDDKPRHKFGVSDQPGLYFLGQRWQHSLSSAILLGVARDAKYLAEKIKERSAK